MILPQAMNSESENVRIAWHYFREAGGKLKSKVALRAVYPSGIRKPSACVRSSLGSFLTIQIPSLKTLFRAHFSATVSLRDFLNPHNRFCNNHFTQISCGAPHNKAIATFFFFHFTH